MKLFKIGDVVVGQHFYVDTYMNGTEGTIVRGPEMRAFRDNRTTVGVVVHWEDGHKSWVKIINVKHKIDPITPEAIAEYEKFMDRMKQPA